MELRKVIAGYEAGERSRDALRLAAMLAAAAGAKLIVAHAYRDELRFRSGGEKARTTLRMAAMEHVAEAEKALPYGTRAELRAVACRTAVQGLHDLAESEEADLVVVGTTTKGALELHAVGSVPERLLHGAPCAVAVAPRGFARDVEAGLRVIGVAYDGSPEAHEAAATAAELALRVRASLRLIGVVEKPAPATVGVSSVYLPELEGDYRDAMRRELCEVADSLPAELRTQVVLADGEPASELIERAPLLSLLVMGSRGYGPLRRALLGSVSAPVLRTAPCPVLVVPRGPYCEPSGGPTPQASVAARSSEETTPAGRPSSSSAIR